MKRGIRNLLAHLGVLRVPLERVPITTRLFGNGNTDEGLTATQSGFLIGHVEVMQRVVPGELLGTLVSVTGEPLEEYRAPCGGIVALTREFPVAQAGDVLFLLAQTEAE